MDFGTKYYWRIVAWDGKGASTEGPVWQFTTGIVPPEITDVAITTSDPLDTDEPFGWENFTCTVTDNTAVDEVKLILIGDTTTEYPMIQEGDDYYYCNISVGYIF